MNIENWVAITRPVDYTGVYEVSDLGRIKRLGRYAKINGHWIPDKIIKCFPNDKGYVKAKLKVAGQAKQHALHRLVALHFIKNEAGLPEVNHLDFDKNNNAASNLEWTTPKGNMDHYYESDRVIRPIRSPKLSINEVIYIRNNIYSIGSVTLAKRFNLSSGYIYAVGTGRKRQDVTYRPHFQFLGATKVILHINAGIYYESPQELADLLGIRRKYIHRMLNGERGPNKTPYRYV